MEKSISLVFLWKCLKKCWIFMITAAIVAAVAVGAYVVVLVPRSYAASIDFYVINTNTSYDYTTSSLLSASEYLIKDYVKLIKSDAILEPVAEELNKDRGADEQITAKDLRSMISATADEGTSVFTITVTSTDEAFAEKVATEIMKQAPDRVTEIAKPVRLTNEYLVNMVWETMIATEWAHGKQADPMFTKEEATAIVSSKISKEDIQSYLKNEGMDGSLNCFKEVNTPEIEQVSRGTTSKMFIGAIFAAVIVYLCVVISGLFKAKLVSEEDIRQFVDRPVIGSIPHWENSHKSAKK